MKKLTMRKEIIITLAVIAILCAISSNVFASGTVQINLPGASETTYTVTFNTNGGSTVATQSVTSGNKATRPVTNPTRDGYTFDDWYADSTFTTKFDFDEEITSNTTIYAKWTATSAVPSVVSATPAATTTNNDESLPQTGDASDYAIFALIGLSAVIAFVAFKKSKKYNLK